MDILSGFILQLKSQGLLRIYKKFVKDKLWRIASSTAEGFVDFKKYGPKLFYNVFSDDLQDADYTFQRVEEEFIRARKHNGVLLYFNHLLTENDIYPDRNEKQHRRFNSVKIYLDNPLSLECMNAIEPLGAYDKIEIKHISRKLN